MLVLPSLTKLLEVVLSPTIHTAILATPEGRLLAYSSYMPRHKDDIRLLACLSMEILMEMKKEEFGMAESEVRFPSFPPSPNVAESEQMGRIVVSPIRSPEGEEQGRKTRLLVLLNSSDSVSWSELQSKVRNPPMHKTSI